MVRFVCLLLASFVACLNAEEEDTLVAKCKGVCKTLGDFIREHESVPPAVVHWLEKNELMADHWDCKHVRMVAGKVQNMLETFDHDYTMEEKEHISKMAKTAMEGMAEPLVNTIVDNLSKECKTKYEDIMKQIM